MYYWYISYIQMLVLIFLFECHMCAYKFTGSNFSGHGFLLSAKSEWEL